MVRFGITVYIMIYYISYLTLFPWMEGKVIFVQQFSHDESSPRNAFLPYSVLFLYISIR